MKCLKTTRDKFVIQFTPIIMVNRIYAIIVENNNSMKSNLSTNNKISRWKYNKIMLILFILDINKNLIKYLINMDKVIKIKSVSLKKYN